jgi:uncharacterized protein (DUF58 family)
MPSPPPVPPVPPSGASASRRAPALTFAGESAGDVETSLRRLELLITRRLDGMLTGAYVGLLPGPGTERAQNREYVIGDDVRRMDWAVTARTTIPHVADPIADRELETWLVVDLSASTEFGTARCEKRDLVLAAAATAGFLTARTGNRIGGLLIGGEQPKTVPARSGRAHLHGLLRAIATAPRAGYDQPGPLRAPTDLSTALEGLRRPPRRRGLAVLISDFLTAGNPSEPEWERPLRALTSRHQLLAVEVLDPRELSLPNVGVLNLVDPETGRRLEVNTRSRRVRERYAAAAAAQREAIAATLRRVGAEHLQLRTDRDWLLDVVRHVRRSRVRAGA